MSIDANVATIEARYKEATRLALEVQDQLEQLETGADTSFTVEGKISTTLNSLSRVVELLESQVDAQPPSKMELWRIRVKAISDKCQTLRGSLSNFLNERYKKTKQEEERAQLFERRNAKQGSTTRMGQILKEGESLETSINMASELTEQGTAILSGILDQNERIRYTTSASLSASHGASCESSNARSSSIASSSTAA
ncbi:hypothetical protein PROFUN_04839 [Planoprotostelium fungivorum]|uniref:Vesicle transport v-SNARE N-terminal domain-containing protein n=1 Tax=Planoprotostelium fungivorum TaxID=1890364 RepID=A0A2P6NT10_9EUKA|nr:hypothetical protein PROFUN_04839 [Planoprotostelium fungivorum]